MDLQEFKKAYVQNELGITSEYGSVLSIIDFGNVNHWFESDRQTSDNVALTENQKFRIGIGKLAEFSALFAQDTRFYYGHDVQNHGSVQFITAAKHSFGKHRVFTKQIQKIRHYITPEDAGINTRSLFSDDNGLYVHIPKCNFDVEISIDAVRLADKHDTLALFSGDADFVALARYLKGKGKKVILIKGGNITSQLRTSVDLVISAQQIKKHIATIVDINEKQKPGI